MEEHLTSRLCMQVKMSCAIALLTSFLNPAIMGTANVGTLKLFSSRCAEYEKFKVFFSNPSDCYPRRNSKFKMIKT